VLWAVGAEHASSALGNVRAACVLCRALHAPAQTAAEVLSHLTSLIHCMLCVHPCPSHFSLALPLPFLAASRWRPRLWPTQPQRHRQAARCMLSRTRQRHPTARRLPQTAAVPHTQRVPALLEGMQPPRRCCETRWSARWVPLYVLVGSSMPSVRMAWWEDVVRPACRQACLPALLPGLHRHHSALITPVHASNTDAALLTPAPIPYPIPAPSLSQYPSQVLTFWSYYRGCGYERDAMAQWVAQVSAVQNCCGTAGATSWACMGGLLGMSD